MTYFENALIDLIDWEEATGSELVDVENGDAEIQMIVDRLSELREIIEELKGHHTKLVYLQNMIERVGDLKL